MVKEYAAHIHSHRPTVKHLANHAVDISAIMAACTLHIAGEETVEYLGYKLQDALYLCTMQTTSSSEAKDSEYGDSQEDLQESTTSHEVQVHDCSTAIRSEVEI